MEKVSVFLERKSVKKFLIFSLFLFAFLWFCHAEGVLQILKKFVLGVWGIPQQAEERDIPFPCLQF